MKLPELFENKMTNLLGDDASNFFASLDSPSEKGITVNFSRLKENDFLNMCNFNAENIEKVSNGFYVNNLKFGTHILNHLGIIYSQEPSAMYPVEMLDVKEGEYVLDVCASPGGKSVQILNKLNGSGFLLSNEIVYNRCKILYENLNRMGFKNFAISCNSPEELALSEDKFDKILVDAPCGGEGMFRKSNFDHNAYKPEYIDSNQTRQLLILNSVKDLLKKGGRLVYSTCTYDIRENEEVVAKFLIQNEEFKLVHLDGYENVTTPGINTLNYPTEHCYRRYPHRHRGEGQFMAVLEKIGNENISNTIFKNKNFNKISNKDKNILYDNLNAVFDINKHNIVKKNDDFFILPSTTLSLKNLNIVSIGCIVGTYTNKNFKINHNFYHTYGDDFTNKINLSYDDIFKYLHGEEIEYNAPNGIYAICYNNIPLGGGKIVNEKIKNYYPKNLRI